MVNGEDNMEPGPLSASGKGVAWQIQESAVPFWAELSATLVSEDLRCRSATVASLGTSLA